MLSVLCTTGLQRQSRDYTQGLRDTVSRKDPASECIWEGEFLAATCLFRDSTRRHWVQDLCAIATGSRGTQITESRIRGKAKRAGHPLRCLHIPRIPSPQKQRHSVVVASGEDKTGLDTKL